MIKLNKILIRSLLVAVAINLASCTMIHLAKNAEEGVLLSDKGLLTGSLLIVQNGEKIEFPIGNSGLEIQVKDIKSGRLYVHWLTKPEFILSLPPGHYSLTEIRAASRLFNSTSDVARKESNSSLAELAGVLLQLSANSGPTHSDPGPTNLLLANLMTQFEIKEHEVTYIGSLKITVPDQIGSGKFDSNLTVIDEQDKTAAFYQTRFHEITQVNKCLPEKRESSIVSSME